MFRGFSDKYNIELQNKNESDVKNISKADKIKVCRLAKEYLKAKIQNKRNRQSINSTT